VAGVVLDRLTKVYADGTRAVTDLSLDVADGELLVLVGPSGSGKTTVLRLTAGLEELTDGEIRIGNRVVTDLEPGARDIAMVFQNYALYPHMSAYDNMAFGLKLRGVGKQEIERRVRGAARTLGLLEELRKRPRTLSGGQRQRVAMGRAIVRQPVAFLMDEPLSNLDAKLRVQMRAELVKLHGRLGVTTIYVTHDQTEAMTLGQRVAVLSKGVVQQVDTPHRLYTHPANTFVANFIGSPAMNFLPARLADGALDFGETRLGLPASVRARLERTAGDVLVGLRPEAFTDSPAGDAPGAGGLRATVEITEQLGPEVIAYVRIDGLATVDLGERPVELNGALAVRLDARTQVRPGAPVTLAADVEQVHLFDAESGAALLR